MEKMRNAEMVKEAYRKLQDLEHMKDMKTAVDKGHWLATSCADYKEPYCFASDKARRAFKNFVLTLYEELKADFDAMD